MYRNPVLEVTSEMNPAYCASMDSDGYVHVRSYNHGVSVDIGMLRELVRLADEARLDSPEPGC